MARVYGLPRGTVHQDFSPGEIEHARINNQFLLSGEDKSFSGEEIIVFLEYVQSTAGVTINGLDAEAILTGVTSLDFSKAPLRVDGGIVLDGTAVAKGFFIRCTALGIGS